MRYILPLLLLVVNISFAQDYIDTIVNESCACLERIPDDSVGETMNMEMGLCIINATMPYKEQFKADYGYDLDNIDVEGRAIGQFFGLKMASSCPELLLRVTKKQKNEEQETDVTSELILGTITDIEKRDFFVFTIKDYSGIQKKYYWLGPITTDMDLIDDYENLLDSKVQLKFHKEDLFDTKLMEYRSFNVIDGIHTKLD